LIYDLAGTDPIHCFFDHPGNIIATATKANGEQVIVRVSKADLI
jgi:hypothetical protein